MALVPALDLRPANTDVHPNDLPASVEAEQALLGCVLYDNAAYERVDESLSPEHFFEPLHGRMWAIVQACARSGALADPILVFEKLASDPALEELGGVRYLADLVDRAPPAPNARDYAAIVTELWVRRRVMEIAAEAYKAAREGGQESAREVVEAAEQGLFVLGENRAQRGFVPFATALHEAVELAAKAYERDGGLAGISTGLIDLDAKTGGLHDSDLVIIAGRPSMGKTALATGIAFDVAKKYRYEAQPDGSRRTVAGGRVAFFSLEMSREQLAMRLLADVAGVASDRIRKGEITPPEFGRIRDAALQIAEAPLHIDDTGGLSIAKLGARARRLKRTEGLDLIVVDYLQLVTASRARAGANRVEEVSEITQALKALAKELRAPVIALSQLSRQVENREDKKPQLADLRESGSIEQDADMVMFVYREAYYLARTEPREDTDEHFKWRERMDQCRGLADLIIGKQRHGPIGNVKLAFNEDFTRFGNLARGGRIDFGAQRLAYADDGP